MISRLFDEAVLLVLEVARAADSAGAAANNGN